MEKKKYKKQNHLQLHDYTTKCLMLISSRGKKYKRKNHLQPYLLLKKKKFTTILLHYYSCCTTWDSARWGL